MRRSMNWLTQDFVGPRVAVRATECSGEGKPEIPKITPMLAGGGMPRNAWRDPPHPLLCINNVQQGGMYVMFKSNITWKAITWKAKYIPGSPPK